MHMKWFGDVYTYAHRALIHGVADPEEWLVHPMLFSSIAGIGGGVPGGGLRTEDYAQFLGLENAIVLPNDRTKRQLLDDVDAHHERHLFLDPDTGIGLYQVPDPNPDPDLDPDLRMRCLVQPDRLKHITGRDLVTIAQGRPGRAVLVFDHSYLHATGTAREKVTEKLNLLRDLLPGRGLTGAAVIVRESPCVCYVLVSVDGGDLVGRKIEQLRAGLHIPQSHLVRLP